MGNFSDIYGYETIKEHLQSAISMGKVSHAYVISGGLGSGKKLIASTFAQTLQCEAGGVEPCGVCHSCVQAAGRNQPDIIWVGHEKPGSIGVDDIRDQLVSDMQIKPYSSPYKIYIIDEADKLTVAAQNAMLKTIEEPPAYGIVILLANNPDVFLQTILSRCVVLDRYATQKDINEALCDSLGIDFVDMRETEISDDVLSMLDENIMRKYTLVPLGDAPDNPGAIRVAMADPTNILAMDDINIVTGKQVVPVLANATDINAFLDKAFGQKQAQSIVDRS